MIIDGSSFLAKEISDFEVGIEVELLRREVCARTVRFGGGGDVLRRVI
jgi:hypothetical protein